MPMEMTSTSGPPLVLNVETTTEVPRANSSIAKENLTTETSTNINAASLAQEMSSSTSKPNMEKSPGSESIKSPGEVLKVVTDGPEIRGIFSTEGTITPAILFDDLTIGNNTLEKIAPESPMPEAVTISVTQNPIDISSTQPPMSNNLTASNKPPIIPIKSFLQKADDFIERNLSSFKKFLSGTSDIEKVQ